MKKERTEQNFISVKAKSKICQFSEKYLSWFTEKVACIRIFRTKARVENCLFQLKQNTWDISWGYGPKLNVDIFLKIWPKLWHQLKPVKSRKTGNFTEKKEILR